MVLREQLDLVQRAQKLTCHLLFFSKNGRQSANLSAQRSPYVLRLVGH